ncbi:LysR substrate-binding domain-containing protein [Sphingomonas sp. UYAg733]
MTQLRDLVTVAEKGGLRRAARHLGLAQPAITRSIRELEHELGATFFERSTTGMILTPVGEAFCRRVSAFQRDLDRACEEVRQMCGQTTGTVAVGLSTASHIALLPRVMQSFHKRYPDVLLEIREGLFPMMATAIREGAMDFYVGAVCEDTMANEVNRSGEFKNEKLFENSRVVMARPGHPLLKARSLGELTGAAWVSTTVTADHEAELTPLFLSHGLPEPKIAVRAHTALSMLAAASSSDLLAMFPQQWVRLTQSTGLLQQIEVREQLVAPPIFIVTRSSLPLTPAAEHLADLFRRAALNRSDADAPAIAKVIA